MTTTSRERRKGRMESRRSGRLDKTAYFVVGAILTLLATRVTIIRAQSAVPAGSSVVPYTAVLVETVTRPNGTRVAAPSQTQAIRSDGARLIKLGEGDKASRQLLFPNGLQAEVIDFLKAKSTTQKPVIASWLLDPRQDCARTLTGQSTRGNLAGIESVAGYRAAKIVADSTIKWLALDYGCAELRRTTDWGANGSSELALVSLIPGEPSPALFELPEHYKEGPPSAYAPPPSDKCGAECHESLRKHFERLDDDYYRHRPR